MYRLLLRYYFSQQFLYNIRGKKGIEMLVSIVIIKLIITLNRDITILVYLKTVFQDRKFIRRAVY